MSPGPPAPAGEGLWETGRAGGCLQHPQIPLLACPPHYGHGQVEPWGPQQGVPRGTEPVWLARLRSHGHGDCGAQSWGLSRRWVGSEVGIGSPGETLLGTPAAPLPPGKPPPLAGLASCLPAGIWGDRWHPSAWAQPPGTGRAPRGLEGPASARGTRAAHRQLLKSSQHQQGATGHPNHWHTAGAGQWGAAGGSPEPGGSGFTPAAGWFGERGPGGVSNTARLTKQPTLPGPGCRGEDARTCLLRTHGHACWGRPDTHAGDATPAPCLPAPL